MGIARRATALFPVELDEANRVDDINRKVGPRSEDRAERIRYWQSRTMDERIAETWRLSVEKYGKPKRSLRDGPFQLIRRNANGEEEIIEFTHPRADETQSKT